MRGVSSLQAEWLAKHPNDDVAVFVVWSDQLGATPKHAAEAAELMPDPRVRHYWDSDRLLGRAYQGSLEANGETHGLDAPAWDVWLLFDADARWGTEGPPRPVWWEHQLGGGRLPQGRHLDPKRFVAKATELIRSAEQGEGVEAAP